MPQQGITFGGAYIYLPGAYYQDDVSAAAPNTPPVTPPLVFLGYGWGPKPKTPVTFVNAQELQNSLRGAPAASFVPFLANPSPQLNGAQLITFIDVSTNTQANAALLTSGATTMTSLLSTLYGPPSNQMTYQVTTGSVAGRMLTLTDNFAGTKLIGDNLTVPFQLAYSGAATGAVTYTVTSGAFTMTSPVVGESIVVPIGSGQYASTAQLIEFINGTSNFYAVGVSSTAGLLPSNFLTATASVALPVPVSGALQYTNVNAYLQDMAFWVNKFASTMCAATVSGAIDTAAILPVTGVSTFFSGARGIPPTNSDYAAGFNAALSTPGWTVIADSNTLAVQALMAQHCETASSSPYGMWRRGFTGSSIGDTVASAISGAVALDSYQMCYVFPGVYRINTVTSQNQLYGGLYAAAMAAAMASGNQIALPLTNKALNATGVEGVNAGAPLTGSQLAQLQNTGVMAVFTPQQTGVPTILSDVTTWQVDANVENTSSQQVACRFWLAYSMIAAVYPYVGTIAAPIVEVNITKAVIKALNALIFTGASSNGVLASWDKKSLILNFNGQQQLAAITFNATLVSQNRFITVFASILPLNFSITASTPTG